MLMQPCPSGSWTIDAKMSGFVLNNGGRFGILARGATFADATNLSCTRATGDLDVIHNLGNTSVLAAVGTESLYRLQTRFCNDVFMRIVYDSSVPSFTAYMSTNGLTWHDVAAGLVHTPAWSPQAFGLYHWVLSAVSGSEVHSSFNWFRVS